jgi:hypothetical protein
MPERREEKASSGLMMAYFVSQNELGCDVNTWFLVPK